ncbi:adhesion G-protein coupled receptor G2-like [Xyrauchen texanus]|uniref:adhesion G-protein coupled receptor G2-like n=1 Tax=Xyrauchen texanus TaxID=154827 RepID=UPI0022424277|nr:adhesion G-protein coupled receptor G2-like [Xyrauchen texanus]
MVWHVCTDHDVKHNRRSTHGPSTRGMETKRLGRWSFGLWRPLDHVFFLVLILLCCQVQPLSTASTVTASPNTTAPTGSTQLTTTRQTATTINSPITSAILTTSVFTTIPVITTNLPTTSATTSLFTTLPVTTTNVPTTSATTSLFTTLPVTTTNVPTTSATTSLFTTLPITTTNVPTTSATTILFTTLPITTTNVPTTSATTSLFTTLPITTTNVPTTSATTSLFTTLPITTTTTTPTTTTMARTTEAPTTSSHTSNPTTSMTELHTTEGTTQFFQTVEATPHLSTDITSFSETNTTFTTSSATTPDLSSPSILTNTTSLIPTTMPFTVNDSTDLKCDYNQNCNQAFYFMNLSVEVKDLESELSIRMVLEKLFRNNIESCTLDSTTRNTSLLEAMEVKCQVNNIECTALLKLSEPARICCIRETVMKTDYKLFINVTVVGEIERVGVCNVKQIPTGPYIINDLPLNLEDVCNSKIYEFQHGANAIILLDTGDRENCTLSPPPLSRCFCTSYCSSSDYYFSVNIDVSTEVTIAIIEASIQQLLNNPSCNSTLFVCMVIKTLISQYRDSQVICSPGKGLQNCNIIVKLNTTINLCDVQMAFKAFINPEYPVNIRNITRVAMCSANNSLEENVTLVYPLSTNLSSADFCMMENRWDGYCSQGFVVFPLLEPCNSSMLMTPTPPSFTITYYMEQSTSVTPSVNVTLSNTTTMNTTVFTTVSLKNQSSPSPANVTIIASMMDADQLLTMSANASALNGTQVEIIISQLESLLSGPNASLALGNTSVKIVSNLLDVPAAVITPFSKRAIGIVDTVGLKLVVPKESIKILSPSLALAVKKVDGANFEETSISITEPFNLQIHREFSQQKYFEGQVRSTPLGSITLPASLTQNLTPQEQQLVSRVQFNYYQKSTFFQDKALGKRILNSGILSTSVGNVNISGLQKLVVITLKNTEPIPANYVASCAFWDFDLNDGSGGWRSQGCHVINSSSEETQCGCNHLTSFGILLDISKTDPPSALHQLILTYITFIGCGISSIFLSFTLLTYLAFGKLRKDIPSKILIHLCLALLLLNLVFLLDAWLALYSEDVKGLCISTAFFLHYFLLASFTWMALEAVHMYLALVKVFNTYISHLMIKMGLAGWGIPLIVVIIVIAINKDNYGLLSYGRFPNGATDDFCWIKNDIAFYVSVVAYFCLVFLLNLIMFIVVMIQLCRIKRQNSHNLQNRTGWQEMRSVCGLTVLLGLTWGFAFFAWGPVNLAFMYLFAIFNTLQGFFIFVFHCAMKENVRRQWRTYLCCGRLRLAENSEWSRTASQKNKKATVKRKSPLRSSHSARSNNSSSSFLNNDSVACDMPVGISNPIDKRTITASEEHSSDVVLNEINDQYRNQRSY